MKDHPGPALFDDALNGGLVANIAQHRRRPDLREALLQFLLHAIQVEFVALVDDQRGGRKPRHLPAQLRAD